MRGKGKRTAPNGRRRVLLLADSPYMGGVTSHLVECARALPAYAGYEVTLATLPPKRDDTALYALAGRYGIPVHEIPMGSTFDLRTLRRLRCVVERQQIDLVHCHNYRSILICQAARLGVPVVSTSHGKKIGAGPRMRLWETLELRARRRHPVVIACSDFVKGWLAERGIADERLRTVRNASHAPGPGPIADLTAYGVEPGGFTALYAGRLVEGKGLEHLIAAIAHAPRWTALIAGGGPLRESLEKRAGEAGGRVHFLGSLDDVAPLLRAVDAAALPSEMEALPMALIEAAAHGVPAVATRRGGIPEVVADGETGILAGYGDPEAFGAALRQLEDAAVRREMGAAAQSRWERLFAPGVMAEGLADAYDNALANSR